MFPKHPLSTPWKHQKTLRFSDVFRGYRKGALGTNGLTCHFSERYSMRSCTFTFHVVDLFHFVIVRIFVHIHACSWTSNIEYYSEATLRQICWLVSTWLWIPYVLLDALKLYANGDFWKPYVMGDLSTKRLL